MISTETPSTLSALASLFPADLGWACEAGDCQPFIRQATRVLRRYWSDSVVTGRRAYVTVYEDAYLTEETNKALLFMGFHLRSMSPSLFFHVPGWLLASWLIEHNFHEQSKYVYAPRNSKLGASATGITMSTIRDSVRLHKR